MRRPSSFFVFTGLFVVACADVPLSPTVGESPGPPRITAMIGEIVPDANTVLLDHFNGSTLGTPYGLPTFEPSFAAILGDAIRVGAGQFVQYSVPAWYSYCCGLTPGVEGTVEAWVRPDALGGILNFNWSGPSTSPPAGGHVLYGWGPQPPLYGSTFLHQTWNSERCCLASSLLGTNPIPTGEWTHLAVSWSPAGSKMYLNGVLEASSSDNVYPAIGGTLWITLNEWGVSGYSGLIDELHISKVQRSDAEVLAHATRLLMVAIDILPGSSSNPVNPKKKGVVPVAILSTASFDAPTGVDRASLTFGRTGNEASFSHCAAVQVDQNGDGLVDLTCSFSATLTGFLPGDTGGTLRGATLTGTPIEGSDVVRIK